MTSNVPSLIGIEQYSTIVDGGKWRWSVVGCFERITFALLVIWSSRFLVLLWTTIDESCDSFIYEDCTCYVLIFLSTLYYIEARESIESVLLLLLFFALCLLNSGNRMSMNSLLFFWWWFDSKALSFILEILTALSKLEDLSLFFNFLWYRVFIPMLFILIDVFSADFGL